MAFNTTKHTKNISNTLLNVDHNHKGLTSIFNTIEIWILGCFSHVNYVKTKIARLSTKICPHTIVGEMNYKWEF